MALVSVIIPTVGREAFIGDAIESALAQTVDDLEVLVVDDGATDATAERALTYPRTRVLCQGRRTGISVARNRAIGEARGEFLVFLDDDDRLLPRAVEVGIAALRAHPDAALAFGRARLVDERLQERGLSPLTGGGAFADVLRGGYPVHPAAAVSRRAAVLAVGGFDVWRGIAQDYEFYLRLARRFAFRPHPEVVSEYRRHDGCVYRRRGPAACLSAVLGILDLHRPHLRGPEELRAWVEARDRWRDLFGDALPWEVVAGVRTRDAQRTLAALDATLRHAPLRAYARFVARALRRPAA
jgi:glycosyltransferase involved in cell wall biosynthesis